MQSNAKSPQFLTYVYKKTVKTHFVLCTCAFQNARIRFEISFWCFVYIETRTSDKIVFIERAPSLSKNLTNSENSIFSVNVIPINFRKENSF